MYECGEVLADKRLGCEAEDFSHTRTHVRAVPRRVDFADESAGVLDEESKTVVGTAVPVRCPGWGEGIGGRRRCILSGLLVRSHAGDRQP
jgi:hypothetical protein